MGFKIECPHCGPRSYHAFDRDQDTDYAAVWLGDNAPGDQLERWFHFAGCRRWLNVRRNTSDTTILEVS